MVSGGVLDQLIGGKHHHECIGIPSGDQANAKSHCGCGIALCGLGENVFRWQHRGDFAHPINLLGIGEDEDVFHGNKPIKPLDRLLQKGSVSEKIQ